MHSYEEYQAATQQLINLMKDDYPNGFEMRINSYSAEIVNNQSVFTYVDEIIFGKARETGIVTIGKILKNIIEESNN